MAQFLNNINLNGNEIQNYIVQPLGTAPTTYLKAGRRYFNTTDKREAIYDGSKWLAAAYMSDIEGISSVASGIDERLQAIEAYFDTTEDADDAINKWNEIVEFLNATEGDTLEEILSQYVLQTRKVIAGTGLSGGGTLSSDITFSLATVGTAGTYFKTTVDAYGRVTSGSNPTTLSGFGITNAYTKAEVNNLLSGLDVVSVTQTLTSGKQIATISVGETDTKLYAPASYAWSEITSKPTTIAGYGITDAKISSGVITLGSNTITPLTAHQSIYALKFQVGSTDKLTYTPNSAAATLNFVAGSNIKLTYSSGSLTIANTYSYSLTSAKVVSALGYTPFDAENFTHANIQSTLGISDWALADSKPSYTWDEITSKPTFSTVATSGSYNDLSNKPTLATFMGSSAIGSTSSYVYWNGSAFATKALGSLAFKSSLTPSDVGATKKYATSITKGTSTSYAITHSLGTRDVVVMVYDPSTYEKVMVDVTMTSTSVVTLTFGSAPTSNYRVVVIG